MLRTSRFAILAGYAFFVFLRYHTVPCQYYLAIDYFSRAKSGYVLRSLKLKDGRIKHLFMTLKTIYSFNVFCMLIVWHSILLQTCFVLIEDDKDACDCGPGKGACADGTCVSASVRCNGINDCPGSNEDELGCRKKLYVLLCICLVVGRCLTVAMSV